MSADVIEPKILKFYTPFASLSESQLIIMAKNAHIVVLNSAQIVIDFESCSNNKYLLLKGSVILQALDNTMITIDAGSERSKNPIAQLRPCRYKVTTNTKSTFLVLKQDCLDKAIAQAKASSSYSLDETVLDDDHEEDRILYELILQLQQGDFILPSLPSIALKVRQTIEDERSSVQDIAKIIVNDPAIAAKIIKASNSALYQRRRKVEDCKTAVVGLGTKVTNQLLNAFVMKELFKAPSQLLDKQMKVLWQHSVEIAALSYVLAQITPGFEPEQAMLAGLIHDIGHIAILSKASEHPLIMNNEEYLNKVINKMRAQVGGSILRSWDFSEEMIEVTEGAENWQSNGHEQANLVDIINVAHLHSYIGTVKQKDVPIIDQIPAFSKLALGKLTPQLSLKVLEKSHDLIAEMRALLN